MGAAPDRPALGIPRPPRLHRIRLVSPPHHPRPGQPPDLQLALLLTGVDNACEVYWNGIRVGSLGKVPPHPIWYVGETGGQETSDEQAPAAFPLGPARDGVLAIRVWSAPIVLFSFPEEGGIIAVPQIGAADAIAAAQQDIHYQWLSSNLFTFAVVLLCTVVSLLSLLMWFRNRDRKVFLWLAIVMAYPLEALWNTGIPGLLPFRLGYGLVGPAISIYTAALWFLLLTLMGLEDHPRLVRWTKILAIFVIVSDFLDGTLQFWD